MVNSQLCGPLLLILLPGQSRFSNVNIRVNIEEKVEGTNTSYGPDHTDNNLCFHLCIHLSVGGTTEVNAKGLNTHCRPGHMDLLCQESC